MKTTETKATAAKAAETKKAEPVKEAVKKTAEKVTAAVEKAEEKTSTAAKKTVAKATATAKKAAKAPAKKAAAKKTAKKAAAAASAVYIQYNDKSVSSEGLVERVKEIWKEKKNKAADLKDIKVYVNVAESKAYYVVNENIFGAFDI